MKKPKNVACEVDGVFNELIKNGYCEELGFILVRFYNSILKTGHIPEKFNVFLVTLIPKKTASNEPCDARPISVF